MKNLFTILLALIIGFPALNAQLEVDPGEVSTNLFLPTVEASQHFYEYYSDDEYCFSGLSWLQRQANVYQLRTEQSAVLTNKSLFTKVVKAVRESKEGKIVLSDYKVTLLKENAYRDRLLVREEGRKFVRNKEVKESPYREELLTYVGIQLPSLKNSNGIVTISFDETLIQTNYPKGNGGQYRIEFSDSKGSFSYLFTPGVSHDVNVSWLMNELSTIRVYKGTSLLVETCYKLYPDVIYDPETLDLPFEHNHVLGTDVDNDGILDQFDNCPNTPNADQSDIDFDGLGDVCDDDADGDGVLNWLDNCVYTPNSNQNDLDNDGEGDACETDIDGDGVEDDVDNCISIYNPLQEDMDNDGEGDACDKDIDGDDIDNESDNCVDTPNTDQNDVDGDGLGDVCDDDIDGDGILNSNDNCELIANEDQADLDNDGEGDVCDMELDPTISNDCLIEPSFSNEIFADQDFTVGPASSNPDLVISDAMDLAINGETGHPSIYGPVGGLNVDYYINPDRSVIKKPIILTDGIDFFGTRTAADILASFGGNQMLQTIWNQGFDLVIVDYKGGADFMQRNAFAIQTLIKNIKEEYKIETIPAIIGPSMGGQIVRYALLDWEQNKLAAWGPHGIDVFLSADSPWEGANASPALAGLGSQLSATSTPMMQIDLITNSPAARQMLLNQYNIDNIDSTADNVILYAPGAHSFRDSWNAELNAMGSAPTMCGHLLAIADGAVNGPSSNVAPNATFMSINFTVDINNWFDLHPQIDVNGIQNFRMMLDGNGDLDDLAPHIKREFVPVGGSRNMDSAPGSPFSLGAFLDNVNFTDVPFSDVIVGWPLNIEVRQIKDIKVSLAGPSFAFIPTFSALGLTGSPFQTIFTGSAPGGGFTVAGSPFDATFFDGTDSGHNSFANGGDLPFFLGYLSGGEGDYSACDYLDDIIDAAPSILETNHITAECGDYIIVKTDCITEEFPGGSSMSVQQVGGNTNVDVNVSNSGVSINVPFNILPNPFYATFEVCLDISIPGCSEEICETLSIDLSGIPQDGCGGDFELQEEETELESRSSVDAEIETLTAFPNPATDQVTLDNKGAGTVSIYTLTGQKAYEMFVETENASINLNLSPNVYFVKFTSVDKKSLYTKIIVQ